MANLIGVDFTIETEYDWIQVTASLLVSFMGSIATVEVMEEYRTEHVPVMQGRLLGLFGLLVSCVSI
eukprot:CAMPEP_0204822920 /NCGR_PEP_ID=MMETSP1346-20131115/1102_1 /ASSEMBLY_ACC=CAM_ASM_000771 /TAXON_ID=215587 /ORGANISM="Aplanochytrium stocchinoi, Strain GSBS06" /LENGTH=66 /DNA_ID=CAMNT_0051949401 /DNA_START=822 /DNA_END=1022 /DNA_ORIENTATION=+